MSKRECGVAVVGLGVGLDGHVPSLRAAGFTVTALAARRLDALQAAGKSAGVSSLYTDFDELLSHPGLNAVCIATPPPSHHALVLKALAARKHVLVEKEFAMTAAEAKDMLEAAQKAGVTAMVAQAFRFSPSRAFVGSRCHAIRARRPHQTIRQRRRVADPSAVYRALPGRHRDGRSICRRPRR